ncbi:MAG TPA: hypothetical protein VN368_00680 [Candidatus Methylomirabilis sp.]|nr:hypothetical protein [Candidatus Methylomirabilis sp.]
MISRKTSMMMRSFMITALFLLFTNGAGAAPVEEWNRTFSETNWTSASYVAQTPDQGYIMAGSIYYNDSRDYGTWVIKTDSQGQLQWNRTYAGKTIRKISNAQDGGYILKGISNDWDFLVMKTDATGQEQWNRTLNGKNNTFFASIEETSDGGSIISTLDMSNNMSSSGNNFSWNSHLIKVDASGNEQWKVTSKRLQNIFLTFVQQTKDGGYVLAGTSNPSRSYLVLPGIYDYGNIDAVVIKTDSNGNQQWEKTFGWWGGVEGAFSVVGTRDGGYMIKGFKGGSRLSLRWNAGTEKYYTWLIKTDASGNEQWNRIFEESVQIFDPLIQQTSDGGYIFTGFISYRPDIKHEHELIKTDANGNLIWKKILDERERENILSIQETSDHGYILAGFKESDRTGNVDIWLVKIKDTSAGIPISGFEIWEQWFH